MIQRIQTLYLLLTSLISISLFFLPQSIKFIPPGNETGKPGAVSYLMNLGGVTKFENGSMAETKQNYYLMLINSATAGLAFASIFLFRKRNLQIKLSRLSILATAAFIALSFFLADAMGGEAASGVKPVYQAGSYFPILQIILLVLAIRAIKKDEELVRAADRIR